MLDVLQDDKNIIHSVFVLELDVGLAAGIARGGHAEGDVFVLFVLKLSVGSFLCLINLEVRQKELRVVRFEGFLLLLAFLVQLSFPTSFSRGF